MTALTLDLAGSAAGLLIGCAALALVAAAVLLSNWRSRP